MVWQNAIRRGGQVENRDLDATTVGKLRAILTTIRREFGGARARVSMVRAAWDRGYYACSYVGSSSRLCVSWRVCWGASGHEKDDTEVIDKELLTSRGLTRRPAPR